MLIVLAEHEASGKPWADLIRLRVDDPVEWDIRAQTWAVPISIRELEEGQIIVLTSGRGGATDEVCRITGVLYELDDFSGVMYSVGFSSVEGVE